MYSYYLKERKRFFEHCTRCGKCAKGCPIMPYTRLSGMKPAGIQQGVFDFMASGEPNDPAYVKAFACMACYKCTAEMCPEGLNPMLVNEMVKHDYISRGLAEGAFADAAAPDSAHRVLASVQVSRSEYAGISTEPERRRARYLFFPGCNVYFQPEKILNALDLMDEIGDDHLFLPGLDHCCGESRLFIGDIDGGTARADALVAAIARFQPEAAILWCPTCHCAFERKIAAAKPLPFKVVSFPQYLAANMGRLPLTDAAAGSVTLHEPCKSAYTGVDLAGAREVLRQLPGVTLREMPRHGRETVCCGSGAISWFPESCAQVRRERLEEARGTGAARLVTVCHYCNEVFGDAVADDQLAVDSYVSLVAKAAGIRREDRFSRFRRLGRPDLILKDAAPYVAGSPFSRERISEVLQVIFGKNDGETPTPAGNEDMSR